jgi:hypothetical protein
MNTSNESPTPVDVILGGQSPPPLDSVVLGGIDGLHQQIKSPSSEVRSQALAQAQQYGDAGTLLLLTALHDDPVLSIRATAYELLKKVQSQDAQRSIAQGIPLKPGDRTYTVYLSAMDYDDEYYSLLDSFAAYEAHEFCYDGELCHVIAQYLDPAIAEQVAADLHQTILTQGNFQQFNERRQLNFKPQDYYLVDIASQLPEFHRNMSQPIRDWCVEHQIDIDLNQYISEEAEAIEEYEEWWEAQEAVFERLITIRNYQLLDEFREFLGIGRFAFVHEHICNAEGFYKSPNSAL